MTNLEKKRRLLRYSNLEKHVDELMEEKDRLLSLEGINGGTIEKIKLINKRINEEIDELIDELEYISLAIRNVSNINERRVLWLRYVGKIKNGKRERLYLWEVANEMAYSSDHIKKVHANAIRHLKI